LAAFSFSSSAGSNSTVSPGAAPTNRPQRIPRIPGVEFPTVMNELEELDYGPGFGSVEVS